MTRAMNGTIMIEEAMGGYIQPESTNAVVSGDNLSGSTVNTFASSTDGYTLVNGTSPNKDSVYWIYVNSTAKVELRDNNTNSALFYVYERDGAFGIRYDVVSGRYLEI